MASVALKTWAAGDQVLASDINNNFLLSYIFGGTGSDGALSITSGTTTLAMGSVLYYVKNYTSISITSTGKLGFSGPHTNGTIIVLKSQGNVTLTSSTVPCIDASGMGAAGGTGGPINTTGGNGTIGQGIFTVGSQHAGLGGTNSTSPGTGAVASTAISGSYLYSVTASRANLHGINLFCGSGGGGGGGGETGGTGNTGGAGGNGGGGLYIECAGSINFTGTISVNGAAGSNGNASSSSAAGGGGAGGGGAAGTCLILYNVLTSVAGTITAQGGSGGVGGGGPPTSGGSRGGNGGSGGANFGAGGSGGGVSTSPGGAGNGGTTGGGGGGGGGALNVGASGGSAGGGATSTTAYLVEQNASFV